MSKLLTTIKENKLLWLMASLTLGLAPFFPEPHLWGKIKWIAGGAIGMSGMDWFDVVLHGTPWLLLIISLILNFLNKAEN